MEGNDGRDKTSADEIFLMAEQAEDRGMLGEAVGLLLRAANMDHSGAHLNLGNFFSWGRGVQQSSSKAAYWYKRAYKSGDDSGALNLAIDKLKEGRRRSAIYWLKRAVEKRSGEAALELARLYLDGPYGQSKRESCSRRLRQWHPRRSASKLGRMQLRYFRLSGSIGGQENEPNWHGGRFLQERVIRMSAPG